MRPAAFRFLLALLVLGLGVALSGASRSAPARPTTSTRLGGVEYVDLAELCMRFGLKADGASSKRAIFKSEWTTLDFEVDSRDHEINGLRVFTGEAVRSHRGKLWLSKTDADALITPILRPGTNQARVPALKTIVIDPGHGGRDPGMVNPRVKLMEKNVALDTAKRAKALLEAEGYKVILTRADDRYVEFSDRTEVADRHNADLFISLHFNAVDSSAQQVSGLEVFALTPRGQYSTYDPGREDDAGAKISALGNRFDHWNAVASYTMHRELIGSLGVSDRGLKRARWKVLVLAPCPATYIEAGYLSNDAEARKIATPAYRQKIAEGIAKGVRAYGAALEKVRDRS